MAASSHWRFGLWTGIRILHTGRHGNCWQRVKRRMQKNLSEAPLPFEEPLTQMAAVHRLHRTIPNRAAATRLSSNRLPPRLASTRRTEARDPRRCASDSDCREDPPSPVDRPTGRTIARRSANATPPRRVWQPSRPIRCWFFSPLTDRATSPRGFSRPATISSTHGIRANRSSEPA